MIEVVSGFKFTDSTDPLDGRNNFPTIADMKACEICDEGHITFCKATGKSYRFVSKNTDGTSKTKDNTYGYWEEFEGTGTGTSGGSNLTLDENKNLLVNEDYITVDGSNNLLKTSDCISYNLRGSSSQYELELYGGYIYKDLHYQFVKFLKDAEIIDEGGETVATITNATYESSTKNITITTSVDLGELYGDVFYSRNLNIADGCCCLGAFLNKGSYSSLIGYDNYNTGDESITLGKNNANDGQETVIVGNYNSIQNEHNGYPCFVFGDRNKVNDNSMLYVLGTNNESTGNYLLSLGLGGSIKFTRGVNVGNDILNQVGIGIGLDISQNEFVLGQFNKDYDIADSSKKNFFTVGNGTEFTKSNSLEQKVNGDLYIKGIGNFDGTNSNETTTKSLQDVLSNVGTGTVTDVKVKEKSSDSYTSVLNNGIAQIDLSNKLQLTNDKSLIIGSENYVSAKDSLAGGAGVNINAQRSSAFGAGFIGVYVSGNNSDGYQLMINSSSNYDLTNSLRNIFSTIFLNSYLRDTSTYQRIAKITAVTPNNAGEKISITVDTDLGTLTNKTYCLENVTVGKSNVFGVFGNAGSWTTCSGYYNYNTGSNSVLLGNNNNNSKTYSTLLGSNNSNTADYSSIFGFYNKAVSGTYPFIFGISNEINSGNYPLVLGRSNVSNGNSSIILGGNNTIGNNSHGLIIGHNNVESSTGGYGLLFGTNLINTRGCHVFGQYNKDYNVQDASSRNFIAFGIGESDEIRKNAFEFKANGDWYLYGIGNFNGTNSTESSTKSLQTVISELNSGSGGTLSDVKVINYSNLSTSVVTSGIAEIDLSYINFDQNNTITIGKSNNNNSSSQSINIGRSNTLFKDKTISIGNNNLSMRASVLPNNTILIGNNLTDDVSLGCNSGLSADTSTPSRNESAIILGRNNCKYTFGYYRDGVFEIGTGGTNDNSGKSVLALRDTGDLYLKGVGNWDGLHDLNGNTKSINSYLADIENSKTLSVLESNKFYNFMSLPFVDIYIHTVNRTLFEIYTTSNIELQEIAEYIWMTRTGTATLKRDTINLSNSDETLNDEVASSNVLGIIPRWQIVKDNVTALNNVYSTVRS